ncbi:MAG TPA: hypothetical protein VMF89_18715, partial [Polyangiales bacterium]|nr:hypothetical protein [Polyangiales bacterium]
MTRVVAALLLLLGLTSTTAAQSGASITDAELEVFCSFDAPVATELTIDDVNELLEKLAISERAALQRANDDKLSAAARAKETDFLDNVPQRREGYLQTLRDLTHAAALQEVRTCADEPTRK